MSILPDYIVKKKLICVGEFFEKKNKKKMQEKEFFLRNLMKKYIIF